MFHFNQTKIQSKIHVILTAFGVKIAKNHVTLSYSEKV